MFVFNHRREVKAYIFEQIRDQFIVNIENGTIRESALLPTINKFSQDYGLSKATVGRAYLHLQYQGYISFVRGRGYFVVKSKATFLRILFLVKQFDDEVQLFAQGLMEGLHHQAKFDIISYRDEQKDLRGKMEKSEDEYDHLIVMAGYQYQRPEWLSRMILRMPPNKLQLVEKNNIQDGEYFPVVLKNWELDFYRTLDTMVQKLLKYNEIIVTTDMEDNRVFSITKSVVAFCREKRLKCRVAGDLKGVALNERQLFIVSEDKHLIELIREIHLKGFEVGREVGIISTTESPWKEFLRITVFLADFSAIGRKTALWLSGLDNVADRKPFNIISRNSL